MPYSQENRVKIECATCGIEKEANRSHSSEFYWRAERNKYCSSCKTCEAVRVAKYNGKSVGRTYRREKEAREENPPMALVGGIFRQTRVDWEKYGHLEGALGRTHSEGVSSDRAAASSMAMKLGFENPKEHIRAFVESAHYLDLCEIVGLDPEYIQREIGVE